MGYYSIKNDAFDPNCQYRVFKDGKYLKSFPTEKEANDFINAELDKEVIQGEDKDFSDKFLTKP